MYIKLFCPAKINLFLEVLDKRQDNYHDLDTVMLAVDLCDLVGVSAVENGTKNNNITITCDKEGVPTDKNNIAYKAAEAFTSLFEKSGFDIRIDIEKKIPVQAGLAGGSADCAGVIKALAHIFSMQSEREKLLALGASLGADVPFCMTCGAARCTGKGEIISPLPSDHLNFTFLVAKGGEGVSTKEAYAFMDGKSRRRQSSLALIDCLLNKNSYGMCENLYNAFEGAVCPIRPMVSRAKQIMNECGALGSLMSGSGPAVFGIFADADDAEAARARLLSFGYEAFVCLPVR